MALKGKQYKLDKNKDGKITGADFALMRKSGYKMGGEFKINDSDRMTKKDIERASNAAQGKKYTTGAMPGNKAAAASMSSDRMTRRDIDVASRAVNERALMKDKDRMTTLGDAARSRAKSNKVLENTLKTLMSKRLPTATEGSFESGGFMDYYSETPKVNKKNLDRASKGVGSMIERILVPPVAAIRDTGKAVKEFKKMQKRKQNRKDVEQIEAKSGKFIERRKKLGSLKSLFKSVGDFPLVKGTGESAGTSSSQFMKRRMKLSGGKKMGGVMKAKSGDLADTMKKLRKKAYEKSMKKSKKVGRFGDDEYLIQKPLPGMKKGKMIKAKTGKYVFDMIAVKPMSGLNKNKKKDGFLDDVFEKTVKKYGLKDPTKKK